jgi:hypothetical protein
MFKINLISQKTEVRLPFLRLPLLGTLNDSAGDIIRLMPKSKSAVHFKTFKNELLGLGRRSPGDFNRLIGEFEALDARDRKFYLQAASYKLHHMYRNKKNGIVEAHDEAIFEAREGNSFLSPYLEKFRETHDIAYFDITCPMTPKRMMLALEHRQAIRMTAYVDGAFSTIYIKGFSKWDNGPYGSEAAYCPATGKFHNIAVMYGRIDGVGPSDLAGNGKIDETIIYLEERDRRLRQTATEKAMPPANLRY